jgi:hypothetical protein
LPDFASKALLEILFHAKVPRMREPAYAKALQTQNSGDCSRFWLIENSRASPNSRAPPGVAIIQMSGEEQLLPNPQLTSKN